MSSLKVTVLSFHRVIKEINGNEISMLDARRSAVVTSSIGNTREKLLTIV